MQYYKFNTRKINILGFRTIYINQNKKMQNRVIYKATKIIISLPNDLKNKPIGPLNKQHKVYLQWHNVWENDDCDLSSLVDYLTKIVDKNKKR